MLEGYIVKDFKDLWNDAVEAQFVNLPFVVEGLAKSPNSSTVRSARILYR